MKKKKINYQNKILFVFKIFAAIITLAVILIIITVVWADHDSRQQYKKAFAECKGYPIAITRFNSLESVETWDIYRTNSSYNSGFSLDDIVGYACTYEQAKNIAHSYGLSDEEFQHASVGLEP